MRRWLAALTVVTLGWAASPGAVPVYDGVGVPDDPYRYLNTTPAASAAQQAVQVGPDSSTALSVRTGETGPQFLLDAGAGALKAVMAGFTTVTVTPVATGVAPTQGTLDGVVYRVEATGGVTFSATAQGFVFLRAAVMTKPDPVIAHRDTPWSPWTALPTSRPAGRGANRCQPAGCLEPGCCCSRLASWSCWPSPCSHCAAPKWTSRDSSTMNLSQGTSATAKQPG